MNKIILIIIVLCVVSVACFYIIACEDKIESQYIPASVEL
jgi:hypothetical protein